MTRKAELARRRAAEQIRRREWALRHPDEQTKVPKMKPPERPPWFVRQGLVDT